MEFFQPEGLEEALAVKARHPAAVPIAGGTDLLVDLNFARRRPDAVLDLGRVDELKQWSRSNGTIRLGAQVPYTRIVRELGEELPALAIASRTVGSPQIRNRGTVGGNLATSSPAGDALPPLLAMGAAVEVASAERGTRRMPFAEFMTGPRTNELQADELIVAVHVPVATGPQQFSKIGSRNAMVIAVASLAVVLDPAAQTVRTAIGSAGPTIIAASDAEQYLEQAIGDVNGWQRKPPLADDVLARFGELVGQAARPIDDVRGTAEYRRHALSVLARRSCSWVWNDYVRGA